MGVQALQDLRRQREAMIRMKDNTHDVGHGLSCAQLLSGQGLMFAVIRMRATVAAFGLSCDVPVILHKFNMFQVDREMGIPLRNTKIFCLPMDLGRCQGGGSVLLHVSICGIDMTCLLNLLAS